jgi:hypothetical protein
LWQHATGDNSCHARPQLAEADRALSSRQRGENEQHDAEGEETEDPGVEQRARHAVERVGIVAVRPGDDGGDQSEE